MANGDLNSKFLAQDALWKIITSLTLAGVLGVFTLLWNLNAKMSVMEATMVSESELSETIRQEVPPPWFRDQVIRIERKVDELEAAVEEVDGKLNTHMRGGD